MTVARRLWSQPPKPEKRSFRVNGDWREGCRSPLIQRCGRRDTPCLIENRRPASGLDSASNLYDPDISSRTTIGSTYEVTVSYRIRGFCFAIACLGLLAGANAGSAAGERRLKGRSLHRAGVLSSKSAVGAEYDCLPDSVKIGDVVSYKRKRESSSDVVTVKDKLVELKAECKQGRLVDSKGREIRFFRIACWGNPPIDYEEIRQKEAKDLEKLQQKYTVIIFECDPRIK